MNNTSLHSNNVSKKWFSPVEAAYLVAQCTWYFRGKWIIVPVSQDILNIKVAYPIACVFGDKLDRRENIE